jgi:hypothetical protein
MIKKMANHFKHAAKGQSLIELSIVALVLMLLVVGMIEFGVLLNNYINVVDGAREGARVGSNGDPFKPSTPSFEDIIDSTVEGLDGKSGALYPIVLDPTTDDVVITYYSIVAANPSLGTSASVLQFPTQLTHNYWCKYCWSQANSDQNPTRIGANKILGYLSTNAPNTGVLAVEVFYTYHQLLKMPLFMQWVPDPVHLYTYAVMPLSAAEPTPTP